MAHVRDFIRHWAPALIGGAVVALVLVVVLAVGLVRSGRHEAEVESNTDRVSACVTVSP